MFDKFSVPYKIFSSVSIVIFLTILTSTATLYYVVSVRFELTRIADHMVPVTQSLSELDAHVMRQGLVMERIFTFLETESLPPSKIRNNIEHYNRLSGLINTEFKATKRTINEGLSISRNVENIGAFSRFEPLLAYLELIHKNIEKHSMQIVSKLTNGEFREARLLEKLLREEEDQFNSHLVKILKEVEAVTEKSALVAKEHQKNLVVLNLVFTALAIISGLAFSWAASVKLASPVKELLDATNEVKSGNLSARSGVYGDDEVAQIAIRFNRMVEGIKAKDQIKSTFGQYVDPRVVDNILNNYDLDQVHRRPTTVFFSDIAGFSRISEQYTPSSVVKLVNEYLTDVSGPIINSKGVIDQFIGDAVVAFWGPPFVEEGEGPFLCCKAALDQQIQINVLRKKLSEILGVKRALPDIRVRMGIATSECLVGNIGGKHLQSFTAIGSAKDWAEELETLNNKFNTEILVLEKTVNLVGDRMEFRRIDRFQIGAGEQIGVYELLGQSGSVSEKTLEYKHAFEKALSLYEDGDFKKASTNFAKCTKVDPSDKAAEVYLGSIAEIDHT